MQKPKTDLSLVMIVKNEGVGLGKAIESCRSFVDEVIVSVDSESSDDTMEVAKKFADTVITHIWEGSFAKARNDVQKLVKTKWCLILDGHEFVTCHDGIEERLKENVTGFFVTIHMESGFTFHYPRIVQKDIEWKNKVHNTPKSERNAKYSEFVIMHDRVHGQSQEGAKVRKEQRDKLIQKELGPEARKSRKNTRAHFYLGNMFMDSADWKKAIPHYRNVVKHSDKPDQKWLACFHIGICYAQLNKQAFAIKWFWKANAVQPNRWEISKKLGDSYALMGWTEEALKFWVDSFKINTGKFVFEPIGRNDAQTWDYIALTFLNQGNLHKAKIAAQSALEENTKHGGELLTQERVKIIKQSFSITSENLRDYDDVTPKNLRDNDTNLTATPSRPHTIEVCFLTYQRPERIPKLLEQLKAQSIQNFNVNIWNNSGEKIDVSNFPQERLLVVNSKENVGSQARFKLAAQTIGNPIIFFDDDQDLATTFVEYNYRQYLKHGPKRISGWFTRTFHKEKYWDSKPAKNGEEVDYIATKAMILDRAIIDNEPLLQNIPDDFVKVEDLYLCYLARMKHGIKMLKIERHTSEKPDGKDQYPNINKEKAFSLLRKNGWTLLKDANYSTTTKIKLKNYNKEIWIDNSLPDNYIMGFLDGRKTFYEQSMLEYIRNLGLDKNKSIVDCGANVGNHTMFFSLFCPHSRIFAFEPYEKVRNVLNNHVSLNQLKNITLYPYAVGEKDSFCDLEKSPADDFKDRWDGRTHTKPGGEIKVVALDNILKGEKISLIKLDIEGDEFAALKGAKKILQTQRPHLFIEIKLTKAGNNTTSGLKIKEFLEGLGYKRKNRFNMSPTYHYEYTGTENSLKQQAKKNLTDFKQAMDDLKIPFCLMDGTLLGAYRDNDFIKNDYDDIDIGILEEHRDKAPQIFAHLQTKGFRKFKEFKHEGKFRGGSIIRQGGHIDFFVVHIKGKEAYNLGKNPWPDNPKPYRAYVYPSHCFKKFDHLVFKGMTFNIPTKAEDFLKARYGDWKTPLRRGEGFSWLDQKQNPALRKNYEI